mgnify:CR=1 FL=1
MPEGLLAKSNEVLVCTDEIVSLRRSALDELRAMATRSPKKRARICAHKDDAAGVQEMIIMINRASYVCPHRHDNKCESFHLIEGSADIVVFKENGEIEQVIPFSQDGAFFYRLDTPRFHTVVPRSENIIFHEVTNGPFVRNATQYAPFAPVEGSDGVAAYRKNLDRQILHWLSAKH